MSSTPQPTLGQIAQKILEEALQRILHDIIIQRHHEHKMLLDSLDSSTKLPHCETCKLPKLLDPPLAPKVRGAPSDPPANQNYCDLKPWSRRPGHDIYGNPFLKSDAGGRPLNKKDKKKDEGTPASEAAGNEAGGEGTGPPSPSQENDNQESQAKGKLEKGEKKASKIDEKLKKGEYIPWHTCPSCKRSLLITRFAKHLEQCMGLSGRAASRNAMAKMNGTPSASRGGTPNPGQEGGGTGGEKNGASNNAGNGDDEEDDLAVKGPGGVRKKLLKKGLKDKVKKGEKAGAGANGKIPKSLTPAKKPSNNNPPHSAGGTQRSSPAPSSVGGDKRDRDEVGDDDADEGHAKKRQKLQRVGSTASILSQSTTAPTEMERQDSLDGSFINEDAEAADD
ncbi:Hypothetical predicted protein [Lecanosticta acicola]|uniref:SAGA-associated factor 11 n=1 Tax=Lecanosticta acicola TaxID=111012 RepID=A0AAI9EA31_9PEZI|nr:Hypothetical predicted protein [Lecanosticta acicola]